ncbi:hypothetical protein RRG08_060240 [Elysia crispata]|uniref:Fibrinogen C-terminal domain-containing protein n=1 Tax=Elysia crispata TaxID=231223 RepID=A0AAE0ZVV1_9GAST|nr:hypothetical protein RRG08_060240 [Elysia crispata]
MIRMFSYNHILKFPHQYKLRKQVTRALSDPRVAPFQDSALSNTHTSDGLRMAYSRPTDCHKNVNYRKYLGGTLHTMWHSTLNRSILCDVRIDGGGWIVIQDFYELRIDLKVNTHLGDMLVYAHYTSFCIGSESENYTLNLGVYSGTAGEYPVCGMAYSNGQQFTTIDRDNDQSNSTNCAQSLSGGGWWYKKCTCVNLNGHFNNLYWISRYWYDTVPVVRSKMMIRKL